MGKLRFKETAGSSSNDDKSKEARRHQRKRRRRDENGASSSSRYFNDDDEDAEPNKARVNTAHVSDDEDSDAWVPPRPSKDRPYVPYDFDEQDGESHLPRPEAHKSSLQEEEEFKQRLFEAMREDEGMDPYSNTAATAGLAFDYREDLNDLQRARMYSAGKVATDRFVDPRTGAILNRVVFKDAMTEEDYAEHIRQGMFRRTRKEEVARQEELARLQAAKERKRAEDIARTKVLEAEKLRKLEERARRKAQAGSVKSREAYQAAWARLVDPKLQTQELRSDEFPWPISGDAGGEIDKKAIKIFLTAHLDDEPDKAEKAKKAKQAIRTAVLAYHPDRFDRYVQRVKNDLERESVRAMGLRISQLLNELLQDM